MNDFLASMKGKQVLYKGGNYIFDRAYDLQLSSDEYPAFAWYGFTYIGDYTPSCWVTTLDGGKSFILDIKE